MGRPELEGEWIQGWPDRARARLMPSKDAQGRTIYARTPLLELEGLITPTDAFYIVAQLNMCEPIHPDDYSFAVTTQNGDKYFFRAQVMSFKVSVGGVDTITNATIMLEITTNSAGVGIVEKLAP